MTKISDDLRKFLAAWLDWAEFKLPSGVVEVIAEFLRNKEKFNASGPLQT